MAVIEAIKTTYLENSSATSVAFSSIPATYEHLQLRISSHDLYDTTYDYLYIRLNSDSGSNYSSHSMEGYSGTGTTAGGSLNQSYAKLGSAVGSWSTVGVATYSANLIDILDYADSAKKTTMMCLGGNSVGAQTIRPSCALWNSTNAVNRIEVYVIYTAAFQRGTEMTLYGLNSS